MKRVGMLVFLCLAVAAGFAGSMAKDWLVEPVYAQAKPVKIALIDLGKACRASAKFSALNRQWEEAKKREQDETMKSVNDLKAKTDKLKALEKSPSTDEEADFLRPEIAALEKFLEWNKERQHRYFEALIDEFQKQVLEQVLGETEKYCQTGGYHLCLQDFDVPMSGEDDLFRGATYSERWLRKPVLFSPGVKAKNNPYVTDITEDIINRVK